LESLEGRRFRPRRSILIMVEACTEPLAVRIGEGTIHGLLLNRPIRKVRNPNNNRVDRIALDLYIHWE
jgi:hypothetical protein